MNPIKIETDRLIIKPLTIDDINDYLELMNHKTSELFAGKRFSLNKSNAQEFLNSAHPDDDYYGIHLKQTKKMIGIINISIPEEYPFNNVKLEPNSREFSALLSPKYWGKSIIEESSLKLINHYIINLDISAIYSIVANSNKQSIVLMKKLGFETISKVKKLIITSLPKSTIYTQFKISNDDWYDSREIDMLYDVCDNTTINKNILQQFLKLDQETYSSDFFIDLKTTTKFNEYCPLMYNYIISKISKRVVGYISMYPITENTYNKIKLGEFLDSGISENDIINPTTPGFYSLYLSSIVIKHKHQNTGLIYKLIAKKIQTLANLHKNNIYFNKIIADVVSKDGKKISKHFNLKFHLKSNHKSKIYLWETDNNAEACYDNLYSIIDKTTYNKFTKHKRNFFL